jgi:predicted nucleotidyltransferase
MSAELLDSCRVWLAQLPERFRVSVAGVAEEMLTAYPDIKGLIVIGSVAEGVFDERSDIDLVYIRDELIPKESIVRIKQHWPLSHFVARTPTGLQEELRQWIAQRIEDVLAWPSDPRDLRNKLINLGVFFLVSKGIVATTKHGLRIEFARHAPDSALRDAVLLATDRQRRDDQYSQPELDTMALAVGFLRQHIDV